MSPSEDKAGSDDVELNLGDAVDMSTFNQILEMDEPGDAEFSASIIFGFFDQAEETFQAMHTAISERDLEALSSLGHFLKGSSATLGLVKVRDGCEKIERYGKHENVDGSTEPDADPCLQRIAESLAVVEADYEDVAQTLRRYYDKIDKEKEEA